MHVQNVLHAASENTRCKKSPKNSLSGHHRTTLSGYIFATKACTYVCILRARVQPTLDPYAEAF